MNNDEQIQYLANIYYIARCDGRFEVEEDYLLQEIAKGIGAGYLETRKALDKSMADGFEVKFPTRFSEKIRNFEDMLLVAFYDNKLEQTEKKIIVSYVKQIDIEQKQIDIIKEEIKQRLKDFKKRQP
jgi:tellurite resistance protein